MSSSSINSQNSSNRVFLSQELSPIPLDSAVREAAYPVIRSLAASNMTFGNLYGMPSPPQEHPASHLVNSSLSDSSVDSFEEFYREESSQILAPSLESTTSTTYPEDGVNPLDYSQSDIGDLLEDLFDMTTEEVYQAATSKPQDATENNRSRKRRRTSSNVSTQPLQKRQRAEMLAERVCYICSTSETWVWRKGPGGVDLCRKDGISYQRAKKKAIDKGLGLDKRFTDLNAPSVDNSFDLAEISHRRKFIFLGEQDAEVLTKKICHVCSVANALVKHKGPSNTYLCTADRERYHRALEEAKKEGGNSAETLIQRLVELSLPQRPNFFSDIEIEERRISVFLLKSYAKKQNRICHICSTTQTSKWYNGPSNTSLCITDGRRYQRYARKNTEVNDREFLENLKKRLIELSIPEMLNSFNSAQIEERRNFVFLLRSNTKKQNRICHICSTSKSSLWWYNGPANTSLCQNDRDKFYNAKRKAKKQGQGFLENLEQRFIDLPIPEKSGLFNEIQVQERRDFVLLGKPFPSQRLEEATYEPTAYRNPDPSLGNLPINSPSLPEENPEALHVQILQVTPISIQPTVFLDEVAHSPEQETIGHISSLFPASFADEEDEEAIFDRFLSVTEPLVAVGDSQNRSGQQSALPETSLTNFNVSPSVIQSAQITDTIERSEASITEPVQKMQHTEQIARICRVCGTSKGRKWYNKPVRLCEPDFEKFKTIKQVAEKEGGAALQDLIERLTTGLEDPKVDFSQSEKDERRIFAFGSTIERLSGNHTCHICGTSSSNNFHKILNFNLCNDDYRRYKQTEADAQRKGEEQSLANLKKRFVKHKTPEDLSNNEAARERIRDYVFFGKKTTIETQDAMVSAQPIPQRIGARPVSLFSAPSPSFVLDDEEEEIPSYIPNTQLLAEQNSDPVSLVEPAAYRNPGALGLSLSNLPTFASLPEENPEAQQGRVLQSAPQESRHIESMQEVYFREVRVNPASSNVKKVCHICGTSKNRRMYNQPTEAYFLCNVDYERYGRAKRKAAKEDEALIAKGQSAKYVKALFDRFVKLGAPVSDSYDTENKDERRKRVFSEKQDEADHAIQPMRVAGRSQKGVTEPMQKKQRTEKIARICRVCGTTKALKWYKNPVRLCGSDFEKFKVVKQKAEKEAGTALQDLIERLTTGLEDPRADFSQSEKDERRFFAFGSTIKLLNRDRVCHICSTLNSIRWQNLLGFSLCNSDYCRYKRAVKSAKEKGGEQALANLQERFLKYKISEGLSGDEATVERIRDYVFGISASQTQDTIVSVQPIPQRPDARPVQPSLAILENEEEEETLNTQQLVEQRSDPVSLIELSSTDEENEEASLATPSQIFLRQAQDLPINSQQEQRRHVEHTSRESVVDAEARNLVHAALSTQTEARAIARNQERARRHAMMLRQQKRGSAHLQSSLSGNEAARRLVHAVLYGEPSVPPNRGNP